MILFLKSFGTAPRRAASSVLASRREKEVIKKRLLFSLKRNKIRTNLYSRFKVS